MTPQGYCMSPQTITDPPLIMLDNVTGSITFTTRLQTLSHLSRVLSVNLLSCVKTMFLTVWSETCSPVACWTSFCRDLAVLLLTHRSRYWACCWVDAFYGLVRLSLSNDQPFGVSFMLLRLCWGIQQTFLQPHIWMSHPKGAGLPVQPDRTVCTTSIYQ